MTDHDFLMWLKDRLINVYKESPNTDFVQKLEDVAYRVRRGQELKDNLSKVIRDAQN